MLYILFSLDVLSQLFVILSVTFRPKLCIFIKNQSQEEVPRLTLNQQLSSQFAKYMIPGGLVVKNMPAVQETWVQSLGGKDPLEQEMATHSSILAWRIPWNEQPGRVQSIESQKSQTLLSDCAQMIQLSSFTSEVLFSKMFGLKIYPYLKFHYVQNEILLYKGLYISELFTAMPLSLGERIFPKLGQLFKSEFYFVLM